MQIILATAAAAFFEHFDFAFWGQEMSSVHENQKLKTENPKTQPRTRKRMRVWVSVWLWVWLWVPYAASFWLVQEIKQNNSISIQRRTRWHSLTHTCSLKDDDKAETEVYVIVFTYKFNFVFGTKIDFHVTKAQAGSGSGSLGT